LETEADLSVDSDAAVQPVGAVARRRAGAIPSLTTFSSLAYRNYRLMWLGQLGHSASLWMEQVARPVLILDLTGSAFLVGLVMATRMAPMLIFGLVAGVAADRMDKRRLLLTTQAVTMATHFALAFLILAGMVEVWHVFVTAFVSGTSMSFNQPARQSLIPRLVPQEALLNAIALNTAAMNVMRIGGGALAGVLLIPLGIGGVYLMNGILFIGVMAVTWAIRVERKERPTKKKTGSWLEELTEGLAFVTKGHLVYVVGLAFILFVFGFPYQGVFVPLLAIDVLDLGDSGVGWLVATTGVGALIGSLTMATRQRFERRGLLLLAFLIIFSAALIVMSQSTWIALTMVTLLVVGAAGVSYMALTTTILLENSPPELQGRVMSVVSLDRGLVPLGAIIAGALASVLGAQTGLFIMGAVCLVLTVAAAVVSPRLRRLD
jgi:MFS family permease